MSQDKVEGLGASASPTACSSLRDGADKSSPPSGFRPTGAVSQRALAEIASAMLREVAGDHYDYACFHLYRAQGHDSFFGVNLHRGDFCQRGHGKTLSDALDAAVSDAPRCYPVEQAA